MQIDFAQLLKEKRDQVWPVIEKYLQKPLVLAGVRKISPRYQKDVDFHWQITRDYPERKGKYVRPTLVLLTAQALGFPEEKALLTAAAMQTSEDWILAHDDFEDNSLERRGKPTLHRLYGPELAVNAADSLHILMWKMLADNSGVVGEQGAQDIIREFYEMLTRTTIGQTIEIHWTRENRQNLTDEDIFFIIDGKTVYYTIAGPMRLGAILAGASKKQLEAIYEFAIPLGRCFQIRDDLLDLTSDFAGLKKQIGNDVYEGKRTIMLAHLMRQVKKEDQEKLKRIMRKTREEKSEQEVEWVIIKMKDYGSLVYGQKLAERLADEARKIFQANLGFLSCEPARKQLLAGIDFILKREY